MTTHEDFQISGRGLLKTDAAGASTVCNVTGVPLLVYSLTLDKLIERMPSLAA